MYLIKLSNVRMPQLSRDVDLSIDAIQVCFTRHFVLFQYFNGHLRIL